MIYLAADLGFLIDFGNNKPGDVLQYKRAGGWNTYLKDGKPDSAPIDVKALPTGEYRLVDCRG